MSTPCSMATSTLSSSSISSPPADPGRLHCSAGIAARCGMMWGASPGVEGGAGRRRCRASWVWGHAAQSRESGQ